MVHGLSLIHIYVYGSQVRKEGEKIAFHVRTPRYCLLYTSRCV